MINVNQITAQLAKLPDQSLQRYAMMHKDDPYIVSLALAESNRRKDLRSGAQMQGQQPQPTVADQAIQSMAPPQMAPQMAPQMGAAPMPEDVGIGQLPAGNMNFAGGGIVAFADGGETDDDVFPYGESVVRMADGGTYPGMARYEGQGGTVLPATTGYEGLNILEFLKRFGGDVGERVRKLIRSEEENAARMYGGRTADVYEAKRDRGPDPFGYNAEEYPMPVSNAPSVPAPSATPTPPVQGNRLPTPLAQDRPPVAAPGAGTATGLAMPTTSEGIAGVFANMRKQFGDDMPEAQRRELEDINRLAEEQATANKLRTEQQQAARGLFGEEQEKRYKAREERINKEESNLFSNSLFQAGLAMMAGTSPHAMVNIGAGAQVGLKSYQAGMNRLSEARDKLDGAFGRLEEIRRNERRLDDKERNAAEEREQAVILQGKKELYNATRENFKFNREDATKATEAYFRLAQSQYEQNEQTKRTKIMADAQMRNDPLAMARALGEAKPDDPLLRGYNIMKQEAQVPALYRAYIEAASDPLKGEEFRRRFPDFRTYLEGMGGALGGGVMGGGAGAGGGTPLIRSR